MPLIELYSRLHATESYILVYKMSLSVILNRGQVVTVHRCLK